MKNVNPILSLNDEYDLWSSDLTWLLSQYTLTWVTLSPTNSRWSSLVFVSVFLHLSHAYLFPLSKKTSSRFLSFLFVLHFPASNSLHIIQLIPCKSLWDLTSLVSWGDKCFLCDELGFTYLLFPVQPNPFGATEAYHSVPLTSQQEKHFATYSYLLMI